MAKAIGRGNERVGVMDCVSCGKEIPVKKTPSGKLSACCPWCDLPLYVNGCTEAFARMMARVRVDAPPAPGPEAEEKKEGDPTPPRSFVSPLFGSGT
jgi:hypothetical protein